MNMRLYWIQFLVLYIWEISCAQARELEGAMDNFDGNNVLELLQDLKEADVKKRANADGKDDERVINENAIHGFDTYDVIVPVRLHHVTGEPISHGRHFRKRAREVEDQSMIRRKMAAEAHKENSFYVQHHNRQSNINNTVYDVSDNKYYDVTNDQMFDDSLSDDVYSVDHRFANFSFQAFGERFSLHLSPYEDFLAPNYTLHYMGDPKDGVVHPDVPRHCFYSGYVNERKDHTAVLSICRGMFGAFRTDSTDYLIQPNDASSDPTASEHEEEGTKPHQIFKRSARASGKKGKELCGTAEPTSESKNHERSARFSHHYDIIDNLKKRFSSSKGNSLHMTSLLRNRKVLETSRRLCRRQVSKSRDHLISMSSTSDSARMREVLLQLWEYSTCSISRFPSVLLSNHSVASQVKSTQSSKSAEKGNSRKKRYLSYPRNVEVMVTADNELLASHDDVEHYVLTLMAIVNHVYHDPSIENLINIVLVKLIVVGDSEVHNGPVVAKDAHTCLRNFCAWQFTQNNPDDTHPDHHDTSVLITGQDICRSTTACDTLGLAELGTMCDIRRSCSINEDKGLSTAFTIAHEIGHQFNAPHDNTEKCADVRELATGLNVMSATLDNNAHPWSWSKCSAKYITSFLDNGKVGCLLDEPPQRVLPLPTEEPGEVFDANAQCSFIYGKGVNHCNFMFQNSCARLWCVSTNVAHGCRTPHVPWADGTRCGDRKQRMWCQRGECVPENRHRVPVEGSWGEWSRFGECSRTCGGGVKSAARQCNNPKPQNGGRYCVGKRKKFRPCSFQDCPKVTDFRAEQCAVFNDWARHHRHRIRGVSPNAEWIPKYDGILQQDSCKLICQVKSHDQYAVPWYALKSRVINGTPCGPDTNNICVEGVCMMAGCDHVLNSLATVDNCGVCNGDNTTCRTVHGSYNAGYKVGYNEVVVIPSGANNIVITQTSHNGDPDDNNYLALRNRRGNYLLNGNRSVMKNKHRMLLRRNGNNPQNYLYYCDYSGTDNAVEWINCSKAIEFDLVVEILSAGDLVPPNIHYRYNIPVRNRISYKWDPTGPWSPCSRLCGGKTKRKILCVGSDEKIASNKKCLHLLKPHSVINTCNTECQLLWQPRPSNCSVRCGSGFRNVQFECRKFTSSFNQNGDVNDTLVHVVSDDLCSLPKPGGLTACQGECLPASWRYREWSECSKTCGIGIQTRTSVCHDSKGVELDRSECDDIKPVLSRACTNPSCSRWVTSAFSQCTVTCGSGARQRKVWCSRRGLLRPESECRKRSKPISTLPCTIRQCPAWVYDNWSECSASCGEGTEVRSHHCTDDQKRRIDNRHCDKNSLEENMRSCFVSNCEIDSRIYDSMYVVWKGLTSLSLTSAPTKAEEAMTATSSPTTTSSIATSLTSVSQTTVSATIRSLTTTIDTAVPSTSTTSTTIGTVEPSTLTYNSGSDLSLISTTREMAQWRTGSWTECSASCGGGERLRYVSCRRIIDEEEASEDVCGSHEQKPLARSACNFQQCHGEWKTSSWSKCSTSCGNGTRLRQVRCAYERSYQDDDALCAHEEKPVDRETCSVDTCGINLTTTVQAANMLTVISTDRAIASDVLMTITSTTQASTTPRTTSMVDMKSNDIIQPRLSVISDGNGGFIINHADTVDLPAKAKWIAGPWSECSKTCKRGIQTRNVACGSDGFGTCEPESKPRTEKVCHAGPCPRWKAGNWGECSRSCDGGKRSRDIFCVKTDGRAADNRFCDVIKRPNDVDACNVKKCPHEYRWRKSIWSVCSVSCGRGKQTRQVTCSDRKEQMVPDEMCANARRNKPRSVRRCTKQRRCPHWRVRSWNQCSATCGSGIQLRRVTCKYKRKVIIDQRCDVRSRPDDVKACNVTQCMMYRWKTEPWSQCNKSCGEGTMTRQIACQSIQDNKIVNSSICVENTALERPTSHQKCNSGPCTASWIIGPWSECSLTCGSGIQRRSVMCSYVDPIKYVYVNVTTCNARTKPYDIRDCDRGACDSPVYWRVGSWSKCSSTCGVGIAVRQVVCTHRDAQSSLDDAVCHAIPSFRPDRERNCRTSPCLPTSCSSLQSQQNETKDGEYFLKVKEKMLQVYCKDMHTSLPSEYVTLVKGGTENYAEIYGYRLINEGSCPYNGTRDENCDCRRDHPDEGYTSFEKIRFDITAMKVTVTDYSFASNRHGKPVPYGVAGDCYSRSNCPQGRFQINLQGTGLVVSKNTRWRSYGINSVRKTHRSHSGDIVTGQCGGYCSQCQPDPAFGLLLEHDT